MRPQKPELREESANQTLVARCRLVRVQKVVAAGSLGSNHIQVRSLRRLNAGEIIVRIAELHKRAVAKIHLIFDAAKILARMQAGSGGYRSEGAEPDPPFVVDIHQKIGIENVGWRQVHLGMQKVAAGPSAAGVLT